MVAAEQRRQDKSERGPSVGSGNNCGPQRWPFIPRTDRFGPVSTLRLQTR